MVSLLFFESIPFLYKMPEKALRITYKLGREKEEKDLQREEKDGIIKMQKGNTK